MNRRVGSLHQLADALAENEPVTFKDPFSLDTPTFKCETFKQALKFLAKTLKQGTPITFGRQAILEPLPGKGGMMKWFISFYQEILSHPKCGVSYLTLRFPLDFDNFFANYFPSEHLTKLTVQGNTGKSKGKNFAEFLNRSNVQKMELNGNIFENQNSFLEIVQCTKLQKLLANEFTFSTPFNVIFHQMTHLKSFSFYGTGDLSVLHDFLPENTTITSLRVSCWTNNYSSGIQKLLDCLSFNTTLTKLTVRSREREFKTDIFFPKNFSLKKLWFSMPPKCLKNFLENGLECFHYVTNPGGKTAQDYQCICEFIEKCKLKEFHIRGYSSDHRDGVGNLIVSAFLKNSTITNLWMTSIIAIDEQTAMALSQLFRHSSHIKTFLFSGSIKTGKEIPILFDALQENTSLTEFSLNSNSEFTENPDLTSVEFFLKRNTTLTSLSLSVRWLAPILMKLDSILVNNTTLISGEICSDKWFVKFCGQNKGNVLILFFFIFKKFFVKKGGQGRTIHVRLVNNKCGWN